MTPLPAAQGNIAEVLEWSGQPYGSPWVHRQAHQFLLEDFAHIPLSPALERLGRDTLRSVLTSDFVQASEAELLGAVIKWGEVSRVAIQLLGHISEAFSQ